ncbi:hypothetical protein [Chitinimonas lacunae]|uniref:Uncharacterized protein n=1 Tax=Chitinimonas lacunae TaxID=1963018 RepID=A0ABV8MIE6_9NEIS
MDKVKLVGYFRELKHGLRDGPSLKEAVEKGNYAAEKTELLAYLKEGVLYAAAPGVGVDVLDSTGKLSGVAHALTDGKWMWPADLAYYVEFYNVSLPEDFLGDLRKRKWKMPSADSIDLLEIERSIFGEG